MAETDALQTETLLKPKTPSGRKSVQFKKTCEVRLIPSLADYNEEDIYNMWIDNLEFRIIRRSCLAVVCMMRNGIPEDEERCYRGLEWKAKVVGKQRKRNRTFATIGVLAEQHRQWDKEVTEPENIRTIYEELTQKSREEAFRRALRDSEAVVQAASSLNRQQEGFGMIFSAKKARRLVSKVLGPLASHPTQGRC
jgi:hypothetical protein